MNGQREPFMIDFVTISLENAWDVNVTLTQKFHTGVRFSFSTFMFFFKGR